VITGLDDYVGNIYAQYLVEQCKHMNLCKEVRVTGENPSCMEEAKGKGAKEYQIDYNSPDTIMKAFNNANWVVVVPEMRGNLEDMVNRMHTLIDAAVQSKVSGIVMISSIGIDSKYQNLELFSDLEKYLFSKSHGIHAVVLRGAMLFNEFLFFSEPVKQNKELRLPMSPQNRFAPVHLFDIGDATLVCFQGKAKEKIYTLTGPVSMRGMDFAEELSSVIGSIQYKEMPMSDLEKMMKDAPKNPSNGCHWPKIPSYLHALWIMDHFRLVRDDKLNYVSDDFRKLTGRNGRPISSFFKEHVHQFQPHH